MWRVQSIEIWVAIAIMLFPMASAADEAHPLTGMYACQGIGPDGHPYAAMLEIAQNGERVRARWTFPVGPPVLGLGLLRDGVLAISYFSPGTVGLVVYRVDNDRITVGEWITAGAHGVYRESLTKIPRPQLRPYANPQRPGTSRDASSVRA
jgi:hypothetical protein